MVDSLRFWLVKVAFEHQGQNLNSVFLTGKQGPQIFPASSLNLLQISLETQHPVFLAGSTLLSLRWGIHMVYYVVLYAEGFPLAPHKTGFQSQVQITR